MPDAIFFDLYETLITELDPNWTPQPSLAQRMSITKEICLEVWKASYRGSMTGAIPDYRTILQDMYEAAGKAADDQLVEQLYQERLASKAKPFARVEEAIIDMLAALRSKAIPLGLISNARPEEVATWDTSRLAPFFDTVVFSCAAGTLKPEPEIYQSACEPLGVRPEEVLFVGDGGSDELRGTAEVGMTPYWATWFIDRWPEWKRGDRSGADRYPRLRAIDDVLSMIG